MVLWETLLHTFKHPWADVSLASWIKYPCEKRPDLLCVELLEKIYNPETGVLTSKRLMVSKSQLPNWILRVFGCDGTIYFVEESTVDPILKKMVLKSRNLVFRNIIESEETCTYTVDPQNPKWTSFKQEMKVIATPFAVSGTLEHYSVQKFLENAEKGRQIMEAAIERIKSETEQKIRQFNMSAI